MKKGLSITLLFIVLTINVFSQTNSEDLELGKYQWMAVVPMQQLESDFSDAQDGGNDIFILSSIRQEFRIIKIDDDEITLLVLDYTKEIPKNDDNNRKYEPTNNFFKYNFSGTDLDYRNIENEEANARDYKDYQVYFKVNKGVIEKYARRVKKNDFSLAIGIINFPFKFRPQKNRADFSGAFNFGAALGITLPHKSWRKTTQSIVTGYSISNVVLDSGSVEQNVNELETSNNFTAFSFSIGYLVQYEKVQAGIFIGWDRINTINQNKFRWVFQGKPWFSIGFGVAVFSGNNTKETSDETNDN